MTINEAPSPHFGNAQFDEFRKPVTAGFSISEENISTTSGTTAVNTFVEDGVKTKRHAPVLADLGAHQMNSSRKNSLTYTLDTGSPQRINSSKIKVLSNGQNLMDANHKEDQEEQEREEQQTLSIASPPSPTTSTTTVLTTTELPALPYSGVIHTSKAVRNPNPDPKWSKEHWILLTQVHRQRMDPMPSRALVKPPSIILDAFPAISVEELARRMLALDRIRLRREIESGRSRR